VKRIQGRLIAKLGAAAATATALGFATLAAVPPACADANDQAFLAALRAVGIEPEGDGSQELKNAQIICHHLADGESWAQVNKEIAAAEEQPPNPLTPADVNQEEDLAIKFYCPSYAR
jgi:hypothetical protein